ncbi:uncharacterized protein LOC115217685 [Octopus sinensis]|uniref:Uncharacterized protein LOC115217685 n=1 Tax=Octopus sinensis TaxID=2607531 RepID=A0A6P7SZT2_9MOLL|nr:uncharacterized protein LOC115217685 [Octopus sinensis]
MAPTRMELLLVMRIIGNANLHLIPIFLWDSRANTDRCITHDPRLRRVSTSRTNENITKIHEVNLKDRRRTINELLDMTGVSWSSCQRILSDELRMKRVTAKFVPRLVMEDQTQSRLNTCRREQKNSWELIRIFLRKSSLVKKGGSSAMARTRSSNQVGGRIRFHYALKRHFK